MKQVVGCIHANDTVQSLDVDDVAIKYQNHVGKKVKNTMPEKKRYLPKTFVSEDCSFVVPESRELQDQEQAARPKRGQTDHAREPARTRQGKEIRDPARGNNRAETGRQDQTGRSTFHLSLADFGCRRPFVSASIPKGASSLLKDSPHEVADVVEIRTDGRSNLLVCRA